MDDLARLYCTFRIGGRLFGVPAADVKEVTLLTRFSQIPQTPPAILGYLNLRGLLHLILDSRELLGLPAAESVTARPHLLLFRDFVGEAFGIVVDEIGEMEELAADQHDARWHGQQHELANLDPSGRLVVGIGKLETELVVLLEPSAILPVVQRSLTALAETSEHSGGFSADRPNSSMGALP